MFGLVPFKMNKDLNNSNTMFNDLFSDFYVYKKGPATTHCSKAFFKLFNLNLIIFIY